MYYNCQTRNEGGLHWGRWVTGWFQNVYFKVEMAGVHEGGGMEHEGNTDNHGRPPEKSRHSTVCHKSFLPTILPTLFFPLCQAKRKAKNEQKLLNSFMFLHHY